MSESLPDTALPRRTTPTWDMELLVSAASVFTLLQLPGWMDEGMQALRPRLDLDWEIFARLLYTYGKIAVLLLAGAFALHLAMRAYWIALVGMDSIYPDGMRWDRLRIGPVRVRQLREDQPPMAARIENADNRSSIVFAVGVATAGMQLGLVVLVTVSYAILVALARGLGWHALLPDGLLPMILLLSLPYLLAAVADRRFGARLAPDGAAARAIGRIYRAYGIVGFGMAGGATVMLLQSHEGARKVTGWTLGALVVAIAVAFAQATAQQRGVALGEYARWPQAQEGHADSLLLDHYRDREPEAALLPTIDSAFPDGSHLTVVVPFDPRRMPDVLRSTCPAPWNARESADRRAALLDCMARWLDLRLDGVALPPPRLRYVTDDRTGQRGVAAVVPIAALPPGEHELSLRRAPPAAGRSDRNPATRHRIAFWK